MLAFIECNQLLLAMEKSYKDTPEMTKPNRQWNIILFVLEGNNYQAMKRTLDAMSGMTAPNVNLKATEWFDRWLEVEQLKSKQWYNPPEFCQHDSTNNMRAYKKNFMYCSRKCAHNHLLKFTKLRTGERAAKKMEITFFQIYAERKLKNMQNSRRKILAW